MNSLVDLWRSLRVRGRKTNEIYLAADGLHRLSGSPPARSRCVVGGVDDERGCGLAKYRPPTRPTRNLSWPTRGCLLAALRGRRLSS